LKIALLLVGKTDDKRYQTIIDDYSSRLVHYSPFEIVTIPDIKNTAGLSEQQQKKKEGEAILAKISSADHVVLLDERGKEMTSNAFAEWIEKKQQFCKKLVFVIGGPYGFAEEVYQRANDKVSLSKMTFSHQMVRMIFTEQLYRAFTIMRGEPYHHN